MSTVKAVEAGVASKLPATSRARTSKVCGPSASAAYAFGDAQGSNAESSRHSKLADGSPGEEKRKLGFASAVGPEGPTSIRVSGAAASFV